MADGYSGLWVTMTPLLLEGNVEDSTTITATIPPDLPESAYNIIVTNPNGEGGILRNGFRVVDVTPPVISDVAVLDITDTTAIVTWDTDEPSDSVVEFGITSGEYTDSISDTTLVTSHSIELTDLTPDTTYYFIVKSADSSGNPIESQEHGFKTLTIDFHITNYTALSVEILDNVLLSTPYSDFSFYPCVIYYLKIYSIIVDGVVDLR
ncbi:MAG: fibronectin type III domain-containing protein [Nitrospinae bacterium]|nr:fibronectin type III domain-containing protein [Nitrospinota bacterium]